MSGTALLVEPYKSELLPHWCFRTPVFAHASAQHFYAQFLAHKAAYNLVGMDMARKILQMGYTRTRRCANHHSGRKYDPVTREVLPQEADRQSNEKAESARIFYEYYVKANADPDYQQSKHQQSFG